MIISKPHLCSKMQIWSPRYKDKHGELAEPVVLLSKHKVHHSTSTIIVEFTKAKHLMGQRFAIKRDTVQSCETGTNGKIEMYEVPLSLLEPWDSASEVLQEVEGLGW